ncbi:uncharacterized protein METZ01_LOCUS401377 [marine metagenome]|uniref:Uncharacterized protein n=1 Tax=marine metagenome TaxID=408172 RepID=A0A382VPV1_9ZZZZ
MTILLFQSDPSLMQIVILILIGSNGIG